MFTEPEEKSLFYDSFAEKILMASHIKKLTIKTVRCNLCEKC